MNKIYPENAEFLEIQPEEEKFVRNLKKVKFQKLETIEPELFNVNSIEILNIDQSRLEDYSNVDLNVEQLNLSNISMVTITNKTIKEILDIDISVPIAELLNIDITEQMQNTLENFVTMVSTNTHT